MTEQGAVPGYWFVPPVQEFLGIEVQLGSSVLELPLTDHVTGRGPVHGGVHALVADVCCGGAQRLIAKATGSYAVFEVEKRTDFIGPKDSSERRIE